MPETPKLEEVLLNIFRQNAEQLQAIQPGEVISFDSVGGFATIQPLVRHRSGEDRSKIYKVPVIQPIAYQDVQVGEIGLLLICDKNPMKWWRDDQQSDPEGNASHHHSNAIFLPGLRSYPGRRIIPNNSAVLEKPVAGGEVRLGDYGASKAAVHEDLLSNLSTLMTELTAWAITVDTALGVLGQVTNWALAGHPGWPGPVPGPGQAVQIPIDVAAGSYKSPSVKIED